MRAVVWELRVGLDVRVGGLWTGFGGGALDEKLSARKFKGLGGGCVRGCRGDKRRESGVGSCEVGALAEVERRCELCMRDEEKNVIARCSWGASGRGS